MALYKSHGLSICERLREPVALDHVAVCFPETLQLEYVLHALGDDRQVLAVGEVYDPGDEFLVCGTLFEAFF